MSRVTLISVVNIICYTIIPIQVDAGAAKKRVPRSDLDKLIHRTFLST